MAFLNTLIAAFKQLYTVNTIAIDTPEHGVKFHAGAAQYAFTNSSSN